MKAIPTLGPDNYVTSVKKKISYLFMHAMLARQNDDAVFGYETISLQYYIMQYPNDPSGFAQAVTEAMNKYFGRNFDGAEFDISTSSADTTGDTLKVVFSGKVKEGDVWYDFGRELLVSPTDGVKDLEGVFSFGGSQL